LFNSYKRKQTIVINVTAIFTFAMLNWAFVYWIEYGHAFWYYLFLNSATAEFTFGLIGMAALTGIFNMDKFKKFKMPLTGAIAIIAFADLWIFSWWDSTWMYLFLWLIPKNLIIGFVMYLIKTGLMHCNSPLFSAKSKKFAILGIHIYFISIIFELTMYLILFCFKAGTYTGGAQTHFYMWCWFLFMIQFSGITFLMATFLFMEAKPQQTQGTLDEENTH
jgi:hypothetical protein